MGENLRDRILAIDDSHYEDHSVEKWGLTVRLRTITGKQRSMLYQKAQNANGELDWPIFQGLLLVSCLCDPKTDKLIFTDKDADKLMNKNAIAVGPLINKAMELNGLTARNFEEAEKNSVGVIPNEDSISP